MYQKSVHAGSQSDISRRESSLGEGNGELGVNVVTNTSKTNHALRKHETEEHLINGKDDRNQVGRERFENL